MSFFDSGTSDLILFVLWAGLLVMSISGWFRVEGNPQARHGYFMAMLAQGVLVLNYLLDFLKKMIA